MPCVFSCKNNTINNMKSMGIKQTVACEVHDKTNSHLQRKNGLFAISLAYGKAIDLAYINAAAVTALKLYCSIILIPLSYIATVSHYSMYAFTVY